jgi:hypothetical protein
MGNSNALSCFDRLSPQLFSMGFDHALSPVRQAGRGGRRFGLQISLSGNHLPLRVLYSLPDDLIIGRIECVRQVQQPYDHARRPHRSTLTRHEAFAHRLAQSIRPFKRINGRFTLMRSLSGSLKKLPPEQ